MALTSSQTREPDFKLGEWWVRPQRNELERNDQVVHVEARSMGVLVCLARSEPKVVAKQRLLDEVWSESPFVGDEVISHAVWELRKALGDDARDPTYIQTVTRKGYRLMKDVVWPSGSPVPLEGERVGRYEIGRQIGFGSMGVVYEAIDRQLDRPVAVKFLAAELTRDPSACRRFEREARLAASLDHPNLATVHEIGETAAGHRYLVTPLYAGGSLKERLQQGPLPVDEAVDVARQLVAGLGAAHARGIVHRDVKPANLLFDDHGTLKIADFGIAKLVGGTDLTRTGAPLGTPAYKSPEQSRGETVDHRTDVWSVGVVLFEMLTGRRPFDGSYEHAVVHAILSRDPELTEDVEGQPIPGSLRQVVYKALAKDPVERFGSAEEMGSALGEVGTDHGSSVDISDATTRSRTLGAAAVLLAALVLVLWWISGRSDRQAVDPAAEVRLEQGKTIWLRGNAVRNLRAAEAHFLAAVELEPEWADALGHLTVLRADAGTLFPEMEDRARVEETLERAEAIAPDAPLLQVARGRLDLLDDQAAAAEERLRAAVRQWPECARGESCDLAYLWLAEALWRQSRDEEALEVLGRGMEVGGGHIRCRLKRAQLYERRGRADEALADYKAVLGLDPFQTTALNELGALYLKRHQYQDAAGLFRRLADETSDPNAMVNLGHALYYQELWDEALDQYARADRAYREHGILNPAPAVSAGDVYIELGRPDEARPYFQQALEIFDRMIRERSSEVYRLGQRAVCLAKLGRLDEARSEISQLLEEASSPSWLLIYAARIYALAGDRQRLFETARRAIAAGQPPNRLVDDAAFLAFRRDAEYRRLLERPPDL